MDQKKLEQAARLIIEAVGEDPEREGLVETPRRFAEMVAEQLAYAAVPNEEIARAMHFQIAALQEKYYPAFMNGKPISRHWFTGAQPLADGGTIAVFYEGRCAGLMTKNGNRFHYEAVFNQG